MYPLTVRIKNKLVVFIGGGRVAAFKIAPLLQQEANIIVISRKLDKSLIQLVEEHKIRWFQKEYETSDLIGAFLVVAATDDPLLNERIADDAASNQLVNVITNPECGNVHFPAAIHRGKLNIAVSTGGVSPKLAKKIRDKIAGKYDDRYKEYLDFLYEVRMKVKQLQLDKKKQNIVLQEVLKSTYVHDIEERETLLYSLYKYK
ncbi:MULTISPECIES: NAD(P)-binding protein [unclassified Bacillus (in: firmicutes)]|uniref:NAD(P)-binding protein n=1 Tax=unclassified Bacillus (in: firmicutes) TaxID=185979 RepID=UPI0008F0F0C2|nr:MULTISPECIES: NAD(P)-binding protein [unclassified Bacillus (in: firmicutes)]SFI96993.1 precorrin-2 dehydrogenase [Bacillus sp. 71mf]SFS63885.1 precorrin-2 dehydrogenase [Bacillus sp. 103mf]